jgi:hypothetical protein
LSARKAVKVINGDDIPRMQRQAVAKKIAPYFHPKLKPVPPGAGAATILSTIAEGPTEDDAEGVAARRQHIRKRLFKDFE